MATAELNPEAVRRGATIRALRVAYDVSITDLASALDKSRPYLSNVESGRKMATVGLCKDIADFLGVPYAAILAPGYDRIASAS